MAKPSDYEWAKVMRAARLRELELCRCAWPASVLRNGSGHDPACPAHLDFVARRDEHSDGSADG